MPEDASAAPTATIEEFREQYWEDKDRGTVQPLHVYLKRFALDELDLAKEYVRLQEGTAPPRPSLRIDYDALREGMILGRYELVRELGRGGQGVVWLAREAKLQRRVALKFLSGGPSEVRLKRLSREANNLSRLNHPGICAVLDVDVVEGLPFIAMPYVEGTTLARKIAEDALGSAPAERMTEAVEIVEKAAIALHEAHEAGIVHYDIKPGNIIVTPAGQPVIMDFGIARDESATAAAASASLTCLGTPAYFSPEQAESGPRALDRRADVWSLGVVLFEMVARRRPFDGDSPHEIIREIMRRRPPDVRSAHPGAPAVLATIISPPLETDLGRRYASAAAFAADLARYRRHEPISARPVGAARRAMLLGRRHPLATTLTMALAAVLVSGSAIIGIDNIALADQTRRAEANASGNARWAAIGQVAALVDEAADLGAPEPRNIPAFRAWLAGANAAVPQVSPVATGVDARPGAIADQAGQAMLTAQIARLVEPWSGLIASIEERLATAERVRVRSITDAAAWRGSIEAIADPTRCPRYRGLTLAPQVGLTPIGQDPASGLWEFAHIATATPDFVIPARDPATGRLAVTDDMGLVFVLLPGGRAVFGAVPPEEDPGIDGACIDPDARGFMGPIQVADLDPFFISKYEMTQAQWLRVAKTNPSEYGPRPRPNEDLDFCHPVEMVSWEECAALLAGLRLGLPTEAQWEYAARGGTSTIWWCGNDPAALVSVDNLADQTLMKRSGRKGSFPPWTDGYWIHARVGSLTPNPFGLHDVHGNVSEWCADWFENYRGSPGMEKGTGLRSPIQARARVFRGAGFSGSPGGAASAYKNSTLPSARGEELGLRPVRVVDR